MHKVKFISIKLKKIFIPFCICMFTFFLIVFSNSNLISAKKGLELWVNSVVPSLFPFFIATELLSHTNIPFLLGRFLNRFMKPFFNVPGISVFPFIMGIISGYPIGAKIVTNLKKQEKITSTEAERLIAYVNNSSPLFIIGTIGIGLFKNLQIGLLLFLTHILSSLSVGFIFRWWKYKHKEKIYKKTNNIVSNRNIISLTNLGEILSNSIITSINTILLIGGFIVLFSVIISILENSKILNFLSNLIIPLLNIFRIPSYFANGIISGLFELTNGINKVAITSNNCISVNIIICAFLLGFSGISIGLQILSIISKAKISIKPYFIGKLLQGILAAVYTYLFINYISIFKFD